MNVLRGLIVPVTLAELIHYLESQNPNDKVFMGFGHPMSYRGYYDQLAFAPVRNATMGDMLMYARSALNNKFEGYKGGNFIMTDETPVWLAEYGETGAPITQNLLDYWDDDIEEQNS